MDYFFRYLDSLRAEHYAANRSSAAAGASAAAPAAPALALVLTVIVGLALVLLAIFVLGKIVGYLSWLGAKFRAMIEVWFYVMLFIGTSYVLSVYWGSSHHMLRDFHAVVQHLLTFGVDHGHQAWAWAKRSQWLSFIH